MSDEEGLVRVPGRGYVRKMDFLWATEGGHIWEQIGNHETRGGEMETYDCCVVCGAVRHDHLDPGRWRPPGYPQYRSPGQRRPSSTVPPCRPPAPATGP